MTALTDVLECEIAELKRNVKAREQLVWLLVHAAGGEVRLSRALLESFPLNRWQLDRSEDPRDGSLRFKAWAQGEEVVAGKTRRSKKKAH